MNEGADVPTVTDRIVYAGRVQGVGFRYVVRELAIHYPVNGYVKNLADGTVELVIQGNKNDAERLLGDVAERFRGNIRGSQRSSVESPELFSEFEIRY